MASKVGMFTSPETAEITPTHNTQTTGRYLVLFRRDAQDQGLKVLQNKAGIKRVASTSDFKTEAFRPEEVHGAEVLMFDRLGVAVMEAEPDQMQAVSIAAAEDSPILATEAERINYAYGMDQPDAGLVAVPLEYVRGFRDGVGSLADRMLSGQPGDVGSSAAVAAALDESQNTWGLQITNVISSKYSGRGVRVAVLDTGMDLRHPDFMGRRIVTQSFVSGQPVQDGHGHGTHCIGTSCGPVTPSRLPRYGVAHKADIFVGKVLSNQGSGGDAGILAGINWAIANKCQIVSMSLGSPVGPNDPPSPIYEHAARRALLAGTLIIAAAGNDSARPGVIRPVGRPANSPSVMAIAALDSRLGVASFSNAGLNPNGGQIDLAGPGVAVYSSWPLPRQYNTISGTSMATPHVAGIAALWCEATGQTGGALWSLLTRNARRLALQTRDVGAGLVQSP